MDELDQFLIGRELADGWIIKAPREIHRDAVSACRSYVAKNVSGDTAFVKVLDPRAHGTLEDAQRQLSQLVLLLLSLDLSKERSRKQFSPTYALSLPLPVQLPFGFRRPALTRIYRCAGS